MPMIDVRDVDLYYEKTGDGDPTLLFIHGMCGSAWSWEGQMERLAQDFTCIAYDRRGHSRSEQGTEDQSDRTHAEDLAALIEALGLDQPIIVASSGGAVVAAEFLRSYSHLVRGAVLSEPPLFSLDPEAGQLLMTDLVPNLEHAVAGGGDRAAVDAFYQTVCTSYWGQANEVKKERILENAPVLFPTLQREATDIKAAELERIDLPVLVIGGQASHPAFRAVNQVLVDHLPNTRYVELEGSGHVTYGEKPDEFAGAVRAFVNEIAGVASPMA